MKGINACHSNDTQEIPNANRYMPHAKLLTVTLQMEVGVSIQVNKLPFIFYFHAYTLPENYQDVKRFYPTLAIHLFCLRNENELCKWYSGS